MMFPRPTLARLMLVSHLLPYLSCHAFLFYGPSIATTCSIVPPSDHALYAKLSCLSTQISSNSLKLEKWMGRCWSL